MILSNCKIFQVPRQLANYVLLFYDSGANIQQIYSTCMLYYVKNDLTIYVHQSYSEVDISAHFCFSESFVIASPDATATAWQAWSLTGAGAGAAGAGAATAATAATAAGAAGVLAARCHYRN